MQYRRDIDGLRAIAIIPVILFHTGLNLFSGGFVGVDVFFVISGFLITSVILNDINNNSFTITNFYIRRVKRLFPALFTMIFFVLIFGYFYLASPHYQKLGSSAASAIFSVSNIYFWRNTGGYFANAIESMPLLHTWSLGVEEQYYIFYPILLIIIAKFFKKRFLPFLIAITIISFWINIYEIYKHPNATFYLFPPRAWELMIGGILAIGYPKKINNKVLNNLISLIGLSLILYSVFFFNSQTRFPGYYALIPCIGAFLIIYANTCDNENFVSKLLKNKILVWIGLISYSLYLWHWPFVSFTKYISFYIKNSEKYLWIYMSLAILITFIFAQLSYKYIEQPIRRRDYRSNPKILFIPTIIAMIFICLLGYWINKTRGLINIRFNGDMYKIANGSYDYNMNRNKFMCPRKYNVKWSLFPDLGVKNKENYDFVLFGDSHAEAISKAFDLFAKKYGLKGKLISLTGNIPFYGVSRNGRYCYKKEVKDILFDKVFKHKIKNIFLVGRWAIYIKNLYRHEPGNRFIVIYDNVSGVLYNYNYEEQLKVFKRGLKRTLELLKKNGIQRVFILADVPPIGWNVPCSLSTKYLISKYISKNHLIKLESPSLDDYLNREKEVMEIFKSMKNKFNFYLIKTYTIFFKNPLHSTILDKEGYPLYFDDDHLSHKGDYFVYQNLIELDNVFKKLSNAKNL